MILGCHLSIAGGVHHALESAHDYGLQTVAMFVRNQRQWRAPALRDDQVAIFLRTRRQTRISPVVAHGSYLVNLAGHGEFHKLSVATTADELDRCGRLGIDYFVMHPGSAEDAAAGIARLCEALNELIANCPHKRPKVFLESTAGQGGSLGWNFEQLAEMLRLLKPARRL